MTDVVTAFLRNRGELLLLRRSDEVGTYVGRWGGVSGYVEPGTDEPIEDARREVREEVGFEDPTLVRRGDPLSLTDDDREWTVYPFLFDVDERDVDPNYELADWEWAPAPAMRSLETVPALWDAYRHVAPNVDSIAADETHGAAWLSGRALEVLRDEAAVAADQPDGDWEAVAEVARDLLAARPSMAALANRVNRAMVITSGGGEAEELAGPVIRAEELAEEDASSALSSDADLPDAPPRTPAAVVESAQATLMAALDADETAASIAARLLTETLDADEPLVATISRSGTVSAALTAAEPSVLLCESRPACEGVDVADRLANAGVAVTLTTDAALSWAFDERADTPTPDAVLVGADTVLPDGSVCNKVGTRALALAADREAVPVYAVAARDKIAPDATIHTEHGAREDLTSSQRVGVWNPIFDRTPADCVTGVVTEAGVLDASEVVAAAERFGELADWE